MKYFPRSYVNGTWSTSRRQEACEKYRQRLYGLGLAPAMQLLGVINFHDALIIKASYDRQDRSLNILMRRGDLQVGYFDVELIFPAARISDKSLRALLGALQPSKTEVLSTELDAARGHFVFRILLWPTGEASFSFKKMALKSKAVSGRGKR